MVLPRAARVPQLCGLTMLLSACSMGAGPLGRMPTRAMSATSEVTARNPSLGEGHILGAPRPGAFVASALRGVLSKSGAERWADHPSLATLAVRTRRSGSRLVVASNRKAGCSLWSWVWDGFEYVNVHDYGRQIQTAFVSDRGRAYEANPTEAGSRFSTGFVPLQGSPCLYAVNRPPGTQATLAVPLEYEPVRWGGSLGRAFLWRDVRIGKEITLDYLGLGPVAKYTSIVAVPAAVPGAGVEIPSIYLPASLSRFYGYDAGSGELVRQDPEQEGGTLPPSGYGGVIAATPDGARAFGQYGVVDSLGGSVSPAAGGFSYFLFPDAGDTLGPSANATAKIRALHGGLHRGENRLTTYLMSGTLREVRALMDSLYAHREVAR